MYTSAYPHHSRGQALLFRKYYLLLHTHSRTDRGCRRKPTQRGGATGPEGVFIMTTHRNGKKERGQQQ